MMKKIASLAAILLALALIACSGDEPGSSTPTPAASATATVEATPTPIPTPPPLPTTAGARKVPLTIWLVDAATGEASTLVEDYGSRSYDAAFNGDEDAVVVTHALETKREVSKFSLSGDLMSRETEPFGFVLCKDTASGAEIHGSVYAGFSCPKTVLSLSPDGRWVMYWMDAATADDGGPEADFDAWGMDLQTGERFLLQAALHHCGGCDGRYGPGWSEDGRFVYFAELGPPGNAFLSEMAGRTTKLLGHGNEVSEEPRWSPAGNLLLHRSDSGGVVLEDLDNGTRRDIPGLLWPADFDASGRYVYSPAFGMRWDKLEPGQARPQTVVFDLHANRVVATLTGSASYVQLYRDMNPVVPSTTGLIVALEFADGCAGTAVYRDTQRIACVEDASGATISPDGRKIALARQTGQSGPVDYPDGGAVGLPEYEIVIFEVASGKETVAAEGAVGDQPPELQWDESSSHLLVKWPMHSGL